MIAVQYTVNGKAAGASFQDSLSYITFFYFRNGLFVHSFNVVSAPLAISAVPVSQPSKVEQTEYLG